MIANKAAREWAEARVEELPRDYEDGYVAPSDIADAIFAAWCAGRDAAAECSAQEVSVSGCRDSGARYSEDAFLVGKRIAAKIRALEPS